MPRVPLGLKRVLDEFDMVHDVDTYDPDHVVTTCLQVLYAKRAWRTEEVRVYKAVVPSLHVMTCIDCIAMYVPPVETCGAIGCEHGTVCADGKKRCYRCRRERP